MRNNAILCLEVLLVNKTLSIPLSVIPASCIRVDHDDVICGCDLIVVLRQLVRDIAAPMQGKVDPTSVGSSVLACKRYENVAVFSV